MKLFGMIGLILIACTVVAFAGPKLEFVGGPTYDWGVVKMGKSTMALKGTAKIKNVGNETLIVYEVKPTCGCTTAPISKDTLKPNETATIDITLKVSHSGAVSKTIKVYANDVDEKKPHYYKLKARVESDLEVSPKYFTFGNMEVGREGKASIDIVNNSDRDIRVELQEVQPPSLFVDIEKGAVVRAHESLKVYGTFTPGKEGSFNCSVVFKTNHPEFEELRVNGWGKVAASKIYNN